MTKSELIERIKELKQQINYDFECSSDKVNNLYYDLLADIQNNYDDIEEDR